MAINLYIMRHGDAQPYAASDAMRQLTPRGREEVSRNAAYLQKQAGQFDLVMVSPYIRAIQTQQIVCQVTGEPKRLVTTEDLVPEGSASGVYDYVVAAAELYQSQNILLVSHMPLVSYLVAEFTVDNKTPIFLTAAVAQIRFDLDTKKGDLVGVQAP